MKQQKDSTFHRYSLTQEESVMGLLLTEANKLVIQNTIADIADQMIGLIHDPLNLHEYFVQKAYLKGQMDALKYLLTSSESQVVQDLFAQTEQSSQSDSDFKLNQQFSSSNSAFQ